MTKYGSADAQPILLDGNDLQGYLTDLTEDIEQPTEDTTVLGDSWASAAAVTPKKFAVEVKGFYDDGATEGHTTGDGGINAALVSGNGTSRILNYGFAGNTAGRRCVGIEAVIQSDYQRLASLGALQKIDAKFMGSGQVDECLILLPHAALSGTSGTGTAQDNGASSADGGVLYVQCSALTLGGYTNLSLGVEDSADNSTFSDLVSATVTDVDAVRTTVAGTVEQYVQAVWSYTGSGTGQSATAFIAFKRN